MSDETIKKLLDKYRRMRFILTRAVNGDKSYDLAINRRYIRYATPDKEEPDVATQLITDDGKRVRIMMSYAAFVTAFNA